MNPQCKRAPLTLAAPPTGRGGARDPVEQLGRVLYAELERLAPGMDDFVEWNSADVWVRDLHRLAVLRLLRERDLIFSAFATAHDH